MKTNATIDTKKVLNTIDNTLDELRDNIKIDELSSEDKKAISSEIDEVIALALEVKNSINNK
jgi:hypothetical protein